jgi:outer membrane protein TolC
VACERVLVLARGRLMFDGEPRALADVARGRVWELRTAEGRVGTTRDLVTSARASAEVAQGRYKEGVGSILDLLNAQAALELALAEDVRARADFLVALARTARASGRLDLPAQPTGLEGSRAP